MKTVCAWCFKVIAEGPGPVSHGICQECERSMYRLVDAENPDGPRQPQKAKVVCPWCNKVIEDGLDYSRTYRTCPECEKVFMEEFVIPYHRLVRELRRYGGRSYPEEFYDPAIDHLKFLLFIFVVLAMVLLASIALNHLTGGWVPDLIQLLIDHAPE